MQLREVLVPKSSGQRSPVILGRGPAVVYQLCSVIGGEQPEQSRALKHSHGLPSITQEAIETVSQ